MQTPMQNLMLVLISALAFLGCSQSESTLSLTPSPAPQSTLPQNSDAGVLTGGGTIISQACPAPVADAGPQTPIYVEAAFPGKTAADLTAVRIIWHWVPGTNSMLPGYSDTYGGGYVRDGFVAAYCGTGTNVFADQVTFILP